MKPLSLKVGVDVPWVTGWTGEPSLGGGHFRLSAGPG
jgi:hypothetical protein